MPLAKAYPPSLSALTLATTSVVSMHPPPDLLLQILSAKWPFSLHISTNFYKQLVLQLVLLLKQRRPNKARGQGQVVCPSVLDLSTSSREKRFAWQFHCWLGR
jgi:hypothetical protein